MLVAIIGAGTMGSGIAQACAVTGYQVIMRDLNEAALARGQGAIEQSLARIVKKGNLSEEAKVEALARIETVTDLSACAKADIIIEAVFEDIKVKKELWQALNEHLRPDTLLATNTSSLSATEIASFVAYPERFCGLHFFNPVAMMPLVEVVKALQSSDDTMAQAKSFVESIGKSPIVCADKPGFIVNRLLVPYINDAVHALSEGIASAEDIDKAMKLGANMPIGPLALADLVGLDVQLAASESLYKEFGDSKFRVAPLVRQMVRAGKLGRKTGEGFYKY
ncbi:MAG: 3-hydroxyacyl-CoA dehydrogenase NAD-binding domain-containing protein [Deinococcales bacterium]